MITDKQLTRAIKLVSKLQKDQYDLQAMIGITKLNKEIKRNKT